MYASSTPTMSSAAEEELVSNGAKVGSRGPRRGASSVREPKGASTAWATSPDCRSTSELGVTRRHSRNGLAGVRQYPRNAIRSTKSVRVGFKISVPSANALPRDTGRTMGRGTAAAWPHRLSVVTVVQRDDLALVNVSLWQRGCASIALHHVKAEVHVEGMPAGDSSARLSTARLSAYRIMFTTVAAGKETPVVGVRVGISKVQPPPPALATTAWRAASPGWYRLQGDTSNTVSQARAQIGNLVVHEDVVLVGASSEHPSSPPQGTAAKKSASPGRYQLQGVVRSTLPEVQVRIRASMITKIPGVP